MSNEEIYKQLEEDFNSEHFKLFCMILVRMYDILYENDKLTNNLPSENQYNHEWWLNKFSKLL
jgi:hypothetical protein